MWVRARRGRSILAAPTKSRPFWSFPRRFTELSPRYPARAQLSAASCEFQSPAARQRLASQRQPKAPFRLSRLHRRTARSRFRGSEADRGRPIGVIGHCMGARRARATLPASSRLSCAARDSLGFPCPAGQTQRLAFAADRLARLCGLAGSVPVATIQTLSFVLDPFTAERKFLRVAILPRAHPIGWGRPSRPGCEPGWASDEEEASWTPGNPAPTFATVLSTRHFFL